MRNFTAWIQVFSDALLEAVPHLPHLWSCKSRDEFSSSSPSPSPPLLLSPISLQLVEHELKVDGTDILVTDDNKVEYIELMLRWRLDRGVHEQTQSFVSGFREVGHWVTARARSECHGSAVLSELETHTHSVYIRMYV